MLGAPSSILQMVYDMLFGLLAHIHMFLYVILVCFTTVKLSAAILIMVFNGVVLERFLLFFFALSTLVDCCLETHAKS